jgi:uncharacterized SAM-binding protein YcdF (DUF218 family)
MFFVLSKILFYLLMPATWIAASLLWCLLDKNAFRKKIALWSALILFFFFSNVWIVNQAFLWWESKPVLIKELPSYELGIVLTGVMNHDKEPRDRVHFHKGADRVLHALQLYKMGKINQILIVGGSGRVTGDIISEAPELKKVFLLCGVPEEAILLETDSRNTYENAVFSKKIVDSLGITGRKLLITSAFHMPRSKACFDKAGLVTDIFPADFSGGTTTNTPDVWLLPNERAMGGWSVLIHEWLGYIVYKLMGYC